MKVLFIVPYPKEGASNRVRIETYIPILKKQGIKCLIRPFISSAFYRILYEKGYYIPKIIHFILSTLNRMLDVVRALFYDMIFIHREAYPLGVAFFEKIFCAMGKPIIFDFDDAIYLPATSEQNPEIERFKNPEKIKDIISISKAVIVGNEYLADYAKQFNENVKIIPTSVETDYFRSCPRRQGSKKIVIGWIGSRTTEKFLRILKNVFPMLNKKYDNKVEYHFIGADYKDEHLHNVVNKVWSLENERDFLSEFDIGIMPMPDNEWTKGKCAYKALLYMSMAIPVVASPVGVNKKIIKDGYNGFLAVTGEEWVNKISRLIENSNLRKNFGVEGRKMVESTYSIKANYSKLLHVLEVLYANR